MMKKFMFITVLIVMSLGIASVGVADVWNIDVTHSSIEFSVRHMVISKAKGQFGDYSGTVNFDGKSVVGGTVELTIQMASIDTKSEGRDKHLKSADFFDVENFPTMTFKSKSIVAGSGNEFKMIGDLTMKDVTKEVTLDCEFNGSATDSWGNERAGFSASVTINRQDFNMKFDSALKDGKLMVGNDVTINLEIELIKAKPEAEEAEEGK